MSQLALVYPMFVMVLLSFIVVLRLFFARTGALRAGTVSSTFYRVYQGGVEPELPQKVARHFANLFEQPVLFYAGCAVAMVAQAVDTVLLTLAWSYVAARLIHSGVHLGGNRIRKRAAIYFVSWLALLGFWGYLTLGIALRG